MTPTLYQRIHMEINTDKMWMEIRYKRNRKGAKGGGKFGNPTMLCLKRKSADESGYRGEFHLNFMMSDGTRPLVTIDKTIDNCKKEQITITLFDKTQIVDVKKSSTEAFDIDGRNLINFGIPKKSKCWGVTVDGERCKKVITCGDGKYFCPIHSEKNLLLSGDCSFLWRPEFYDGSKIDDAKASNFISENAKLWHEKLADNLSETLKIINEAISPIAEETGMNITVYPGITTWEMQEYCMNSRWSNHSSKGRVVMISLLYKEISKENLADYYVFLLLEKLLHHLCQDQKKLGKLELDKEASNLEGKMRCSQDKFYVSLYLALKLDPKK